MTIKRPPQHSVDATPMLVMRSDKAWDKERIDREILGMKKSGKDGSEHPVNRYLDGDTRYDLDAIMQHAGSTTTVREFFIQDFEPTVFVLRRVSYQLMYRLNSQVTDLDRHAGAIATMAKKGVVMIVDGFNTDSTEGRWELDGGEGSDLSESDMQRLYDLDKNLPLEIGYAVNKASQPLTSAEGKR